MRIKIHALPALLLAILLSLGASAPLHVHADYPADIPTCAPDDTVLNVGPGMWSVIPGPSWNPDTATPAQLTCRHVPPKPTGAEADRLWTGAYGHPHLVDGHAWTMGQLWEREVHARFVLPEPYPTITPANPLPLTRQTPITTQSAAANWAGWEVWGRNNGNLNFVTSAGMAYVPYCSTQKARYGYVSGTNEYGLDTSMWGGVGGDPNAVGSGQPYNLFQDGVACYVDQTTHNSKAIPWVENYCVSPWTSGCWNNNNEYVFQFGSGEYMNQGDIVWIDAEVHDSGLGSKTLGFYSFNDIIGNFTTSAYIEPINGSGSGSSAEWINEPCGYPCVSIDSVNAEMDNARALTTTSNDPVCPSRWNLIHNYIPNVTTDTPWYNLAPDSLGHCTANWFQIQAREN